jgi:hypothetical protein
LLRSRVEVPAGSQGEVILSVCGMSFRGT